MNTVPPQIFGVTFLKAKKKEREKKKKKAKGLTGHIRS